MKKILATDEYTIYQRRDSRHAIVGADKKYINGADKIAILIEHKIPPFDELKMPVPAPASEESNDSESGAEDKDVSEETSAEEAEVEAKADDEQAKSESPDAAEDIDEKAAEESSEEEAVEEVEKSDEPSPDSEEESDEDAKPADDK